MSGQHCENYDVKRETVHCYPRNVDRCCTWPDVVAGISARFSKFAFVLFCYITNRLMTGPLGNSEYETADFVVNLMYVKGKIFFLTTTTTTTTIFI